MHATDATDATKHATHAPDALPLWQTKAETCAALGIAPRTLNRLVADGLIERRQKGRTAWYHAPRTPPSTPRPGGPSVHLAVDLAAARAERDEAVSLAFLVTDEGERLAGELADVRGKVQRLAAVLAGLPWYASGLRREALAALVRC